MSGARTTQQLDRGQARRIALAAQGFTDPRPAGRVDVRHLRRVLARTQVWQIDSVRAVERAQYLPAFARLGPYPAGLVDDLAYRRREVFECWAHEATLAPVALHPLLRWRMRRFTYGPAHRVLAGAPAGTLDAVERQIATGGPLTAAQLDAHAPSAGWWSWSTAKAACEQLFGQGRLAVAARTRGFARVYDLPERVLPATVLNEPTPSDHDAHRALIERAAASHGVGTADDLADVFRLRLDAAKPAIAALESEGTLERVAVEGTDRPAWRHHAAQLPRRVDARALLAPFDPVVWHRPRAQRLFDFTYRIEIYTPASKRRYGYYVLPFLLGDDLVARLDVRADRTSGVLHVPAAFAERGVDRAATAVQLAPAVVELAAWLGLSDVAGPDRGDLARPLAASLR